MNKPMIVYLTAWLALTTGVAWGHSMNEHGEHAKHADPGSTAAQAGTSQDSAAVRFADVALVNQDGQSVDLKRDLVGDRIVVMGFIYTTCTTVCPLVSSIMGKVQTQLVGRLGTEVQLVSISIDPLRDTPQRLAGYARKFQNGPGWSWLTGSQQAINDTLKGLGSWTADPQNHAPLIMVGDGRSTNWTRFYGFTDPKLLVERVEQLLADRASAAGKRGVIVMGQQP